MLRKIDPNAKRLLEYQESVGIDILTDLPFGFQCKCMKKMPNIHKVLEEVKKSVPVAIIKVDKKQPIAAMYLEDFLEVIEKALAGEESEW
jgi:hypothetical protein